MAAAGALALTATLPLAACGAPSASPRPAQAGASASASGSPATTPSASTPTTTTAGPGAARPPTGSPPKPTPVKTKTTSPGTPKPVTTTPTPCYGAILYDLDLQNTVLDLVKSMCFHTGGILRLHSIGPGLVTATPTSLVSQSYEAAVVDLRFIRPGTVTVTIPMDEQTHTITVVVRS
jgi:hypothetical protein